MEEYIINPFGIDSTESKLEKLGTNFLTHMLISRQAERSQFCSSEASTTNG